MVPQKYAIYSIAQKGRTVLQVLASALGQTRADFAEEMSRALAMETYNVAYTSDVTARRQRRCLLRAFASAVACERVPLLAWRAAVLEGREQRRLASEAAIALAANPVCSESSIQAAEIARPWKPSPLPTANTFRVIPIKGILAEVAAVYQVQISPEYPLPPSRLLLGPPYVLSFIRSGNLVLLVISNYLFCRAESRLPFFRKWVKILGS